MDNNAKEIRFRVVGVPKPQPRTRAAKFGNHARVYDPGTSNGWKNLIAAAAYAHLPAQPLSGPLSVDIEFIMPRPQSHFGSGRNVGVIKLSAPHFWCTAARAGDRDNLDKAVLDTLTAIRLWEDDSQACSGKVVKRYAGPGERPGAVVVIRSLAGEGIA